MKFRRQPVEEEIVVVEPEPDPTEWLINNGVADFILLNTDFIKYTVMLAYTFMHGCKLFPTFPERASLSFKFVSMILQCTGGGTLVPIFINAIPVALAVDAYPIAIFVAFLLHEYLPILRDIVKKSVVVKTLVTILYETQRAAVVVKLTKAAGKAIAPSDFEIAIFGPIFCGTVAGCGGVFLPLNKGLDPIREGGLSQPMLSAFVGSSFYYFFTNTSLSEGVIEAPQKAHVCVTCFFIAYNLYSAQYAQPKVTAVQVEPSGGAKKTTKETKKTK